MVLEVYITAMEAAYPSKSGMRFKCECGSDILRASKKRHMSSRKHKVFMMRKEEDRKQIDLSIIAARRDESKRGQLLELFPMDLTRIVEEYMQPPPHWAKNLMKGVIGELDSYNELTKNPAATYGYRTPKKRGRPRTKMSYIRCSMICNRHFIFTMKDRVQRTLLMEHALEYGSGGGVLHQKSFPSYVYINDIQKYF